MVIHTRQFLLRYSLIISTSLALIVGFSRFQPLAAQTSGLNSLAVVSTGAQEMTLVLRSSDLQVESISQNGQTYQLLTLPDMDHTVRPGEPQVPVRGTLLGLPTIDKVAIQILEADFDTLSGYRLYPAPGREIVDDNLREINLREKFTLNQEVYGADAFYPGSLAQVVNSGYLRDQAVTRLQFYPIQYNPVTGEVRHYHRILVKVTWSGPASLTSSSAAQFGHAAFEHMLKETLLNYSDLIRPPLVENFPMMINDNLSASSTVGKLKIGVTEDGMVQLTPADLSGAGFDLNGVNPTTVKIKNRGSEIPIYLQNGNDPNKFDGSDYLLFYGTGIRDEYTFKNIYWLEAGGNPGQRMSSKGQVVTGGTPPASFPITQHAELDSSYWGTMPKGGSQDRWFWGDFTQQRLYGDDAAEAQQLTLNNIANGNGQLRVYLKGYSGGTHTTQIYVNGNLADTQSWNGQSIFTHTLATTSLINGANQVTVKELGTNQFVFINWIEIDYTDTYVAENNQLLFGPPSAGTFEFQVTNFSSGDIQMFDITDPTSVAVMINTSISADGNGGQRIRVKDTAQANSRYLALTAAGRKAPASLELDQSSLPVVSGAEYIIVAHHDLLASAATLTAHRQSSGLSVVTVDVQDIYDEFNGGIFHPKAIRDFLRQAYNTWTPAPTFVVLLGGGSYDYRDLLPDVNRVQYVPPFQLEDVATVPPTGLAPSDNWFALMDDADLLPDLFIGRITAQTPTEANNIVTKIIAYEQTPLADWNDEVLLVADDHSDFESLSDKLADSLPFYYTAHKVYKSNSEIPDHTQTIQDRISSGTVLVNYAGHGSVQLWSNMFGSSDIPSLNNANRYPVVTVANCLNGFFAGTKFSMAEDLLKPLNKGAVAIWAPTTLGYASQHRLLMKKFYELIFEDDYYSYLIGPATTEAKIKAQQDELTKFFILFGDPAMRLAIPTNYPYVEKTTPAQGETGVALDQDITITFNKPVNPATVTLSGPGTAGLVLNPSWHSNATVVTYTHQPNFEANQSLSFTVHGQDNLGNALGVGPVPGSWSFTTLSLAPTSLDISGPTTGFTQTIYFFNAVVGPGTAVQPVTYTWQAIGNMTKFNAGGLTAAMDFSWPATGSQMIVVTATNSYGSVMATHTVTINERFNMPLYLPVLISNN